MALKIRLRPQGRTNRTSYRVVVTDSRAPCDGKYVEMVGWYDPLGKEEKTLNLDVPRVRHWMGLGAQLTSKVESMVAKVAPEIFAEQHQKKLAQRAKTKAKRKELSAKKK